MARASVDQVKATLLESRRAEASMLLNFGLALLFAAVVVSLLARLVLPALVYEADIVGASGSAISLALLAYSRLAQRRSLAGSD